MLWSKELEHVGTILQGNQVFSFNLQQLALGAQLLDSLDRDLYKIKLKI